MARQVVDGNGMARPGPHCVICGPPSYQIIGHHLDAVLAGQPADRCLRVGGGQRLFEDHVDFFRSAGLNDLLVPVVFDEGPREIRLGFLEHLLIVIEEGHVRGAARLCCLDQLRNRLGDSHELRVVPLEHGS